MKNREQGKVSVVCWVTTAGGGDGVVTQKKKKYKKKNNYFCMSRLGGGVQGGLDHLPGHR